MTGKKNMTMTEAVRRLVCRLQAVTALIVATLPLWSCSDDNPVNPPVPPTHEPVVYLTLKVDVNEGSSMAPASRADGTYYFEEPTRDNERMHDLFVVVVRSEDNTVESRRFVTFDNNAVVSADNLIFKLTSGDKRLFLVANSSSLPSDIIDLLETPIGSVFPEDVLNAATLSRYSYQPFFTGNQKIPMAETFDLTLEPDNSEGEPTYCSARVFVTRIAVKYTFMCPEEVSGITVRLAGVATKQYLMPNEVQYDPGKYLPGETINGITGRNIINFTAPYDPVCADYQVKLTGRYKVDGLGIDGLPDGTSTYRYDPIYLMETPGSSFYLSALFDEGAKDPVGNDVSGTWFENRRLPNLPLLPRNTHVIVNLSGKAGLECSVDLVPYRGCVLQPYFGIPRE
ncbi:MAG: hypothetical protein K2O00_06390 [Muribaculaceae bacterium]|nr:hypothetical protein [Muribaculaceae bacterium]